jgi:hypothetical protein
MAIILSETLTADGSTAWADIVNPNNGGTPFQMVSAAGSGFGSGTATVEMSIDGGTTAFDVTDSAGAVAFTANGAVRTFALGNNNPAAANQTKMRVTMTGSTTPSVKIVIADVN